MPLYEYQCDRCRKVFERVRKMSDPALTDCPECADAGLGMLQRVLSAHAGHVSHGRSGASAPPPQGCGGCAERGSCPMN
jgi:putative FmdB family regulatory protein